MADCRSLPCPGGGDVGYVGPTSEKEIWGLVDSHLVFVSQRHIVHLSSGCIYPLFFLFFSFFWLTVPSYHFPMFWSSHIMGFGGACFPRCTSDTWCATGKESMPWHHNQHKLGKIGWVEAKLEEYLKRMCEVWYGTALVILSATLSD